MLHDFLDGAPRKTWFEVHYRMKGQFSTNPTNKNKWRRFIAHYDTEQAARDDILKSQTDYPKMYEYSLCRIDSAVSFIHHWP